MVNEELVGRSVNSQEYFSSDDYRSIGEDFLTYEWENPVLVLHGDGNLDAKAEVGDSVMSYLKEADALVSRDYAGLLDENELSERNWNVLRRPGLSRESIDSIDQVDIKNTMIHVVDEEQVDELESYIEPIPQDYAILGVPES
ncbi:MAG: hypothetical protein ABEJ99_00755 [Candidatus Nanohaloarchaea archaeon]